MNHQSTTYPQKWSGVKSSVYFPPSLHKLTVALCCYIAQQRLRQVMLFDNWVLHSQIWDHNRTRWLLKKRRKSCLCKVANHIQILGKSNLQKQLRSQFLVLVLARFTHHRHLSVFHFYTKLPFVRAHTGKKKSRTKISQLGSSRTALFRAK